MLSAKPRIAIYKTVFGKWVWYCACNKTCGQGDTPLAAYKEWAFFYSRNNSNY